VGWARDFPLGPPHRLSQEIGSRNKNLAKIKD
jgi:hypothetical protein